MTPQCVVCADRPAANLLKLCLRCEASVAEVDPGEASFIEWAAERSRRFERARASRGGAIVRARATALTDAADIAWAVAERCKQERTKLIAEAGAEYSLGHAAAESALDRTQCTAEEIVLGIDALRTATPTADAPEANETAGAAAETEERCGFCAGSGTVEWFDVTTPCDQCDGSGRARTPGSDR